MRGKQALFGILYYLGGIFVLLAIVLVFTPDGLLRIIDALDLIVLLLGAGAVGLSALTVQQLEYRRPAPEGRPEASFLSKESASWGSLAAILGVALAFAVAGPAEAEESPVQEARGTFENPVIDGDRDGYSVAFAHTHFTKQASDRPCGTCHHLNNPGEEATPCATCHRSMDEHTDIFDHDVHAAAHGDNAGCVTCHADPDTPRLREMVTPTCTDCHGPEGSHALNLMVAPGNDITMTNSGMAPSYEDAMHGVCLECHRDMGQEMARCPTCHRTGSVNEGGL